MTLENEDHKRERVEAYQRSVETKNGARIMGRWPSTECDF